MAHWRLCPSGGRSRGSCARSILPKVPGARAAQDQRDASVSDLPSQRPEADELPQGLDEPGRIRPLSHNDVKENAATAGCIDEITLTRKTLALARCDDARVHQAEGLRYYMVRQ